MITKTKLDLNLFLVFAGAAVEAAKFSEIF